MSHKKNASHKFVFFFGFRVYPFLYFYHIPHLINIVIYAFSFLKFTFGWILGDHNKEFLNENGHTHRILNTFANVINRISKDIGI